MFALFRVAKCSVRDGAVRAAGLALGSAVIGAVLGGLLNNWLRIDIVPIAVSPPAHERVLHVHCEVLLKSPLITSSRGHLTSV